MALNQRVLLLSGKDWTAGMSTHLHQTAARLWQFFCHSVRVSALTVILGLSTTCTLATGPSASLKAGSHASNWLRLTGSCSKSLDFLIWWCMFSTFVLLYALASPYLPSRKVDRHLYDDNWCNNIIVIVIIISIVLLLLLSSYYCCYCYISVINIILSL